MKTYLQSLLIRWHTAAGKDLPAWLRSASRNNPELRVLLKEERALSRGLSQGEEPSLDADSAEALSRRILRSLEEEESSVGELPRSTRGFNWSLLAIASVACIAAVVTFQTLDTEESNDSPIAKTIETNDQSILNINQLALQEAQWENPLDREVDNVISDARGVVSFLVGNFLPRNMSKELLEAQEFDG